MGLTYVPVLWNTQKKRYDAIMLLLIVVYCIGFVTISFLFKPEISPETLIIRTTGSLAILMLHIILCIGPLCRLDTRFLPLLYNRRHLGVTMFLIAAVHGIFSMIQFHALGDTTPIISLFTANVSYASFSDFPFQVLGFFALLILFLMAATSHDFWLHNLSPKIWKILHMLVYLAYALVVMHVALGALQVEISPLLWGGLGVGMCLVISLHVTTAFREAKGDVKSPLSPAFGDFVEVCDVKDIAENRAKVICIEEERIAIFKYDGLLSAVSNVCQHQNGPLGEGKIVDGCITCPWHGYQYEPHNGTAPPPFKEKLPTYGLLLKGTTIYVDPKPYPAGTHLLPVPTHEISKQ